MVRDPALNRQMSGLQNISRSVQRDRQCSGRNGLPNAAPLHESDLLLATGSFVSAHPLCLEILDTAVLQHENRRGTNLIGHTSWTVPREFASVSDRCARTI